MIIINARVLTFDDANRIFDNGAVEIRPDGTIGAVTAAPSAFIGVHQRPAPYSEPQEVFDAGGRLLMPALINCHTHLYSTLARGLSIPGEPPANFPDILHKLWWRLDSVLNEEDVYYSALVGLIDSAKCGVGTLIDHHSSPNACAGSLDWIDRAFREVGLRGALCYETSCRNGMHKAIEGLRENVRFIETVRTQDAGLVSAAFGLHASFTLTDPILRQAVEANQSLGAGFHIHVAEDACDSDAVPRLAYAGVLNERTLAAHCLRVNKRDMTILAQHRVQVVHNPQSNCNNAVGMARLHELVEHDLTVGLGSDGYSPRLWEEFKTAAHLQKLRARDPRLGYAVAYAAAFLNNRRIVRDTFGMDVGRIETGAQADLILVDYFPPTPLGPENLLGHMIFGISNAPVDALLVHGRFVVKERRCVTMDERAVAEKAARQARSLWRRFETACQA